jgi:hypothetical protein
MARTGRAPATRPVAAATLAVGSRIEWSTSETVPARTKSRRKA